MYAENKLNVEKLKSEYINEKERDRMMTTTAALSAFRVLYTRIYIRIVYLH